MKLADALGDFNCDKFITNGIMKAKKEGDPFLAIGANKEGRGIKQFGLYQISNSGKMKLSDWEFDRSDISDETWEIVK